MEPSTPFVAIFLALLLLMYSLPTADAKTYGINCHGDPCGPDKGDGLEIKLGARSLNRLLSDLPNNLYIEPYSLIGCASEMCAWVILPYEHPKCNLEKPWIQDPLPGMEVREIKVKAEQLVNHGCRRCGNVARSWPEGRQDEDVWCSGSLKFGPVRDKVWREGCVEFGICPKYSDEA